MSTRPGPKTAAEPTTADQRPTTAEPTTAADRGL